MRRNCAASGSRAVTAVPAAVEWEIRCVPPGASRAQPIIRYRAVPVRISCLDLRESMWVNFGLRIASRRLTSWNKGNVAERNLISYKLFNEVHNKLACRKFICFGSECFSAIIHAVCFVPFSGYGQPASGRYFTSSRRLSSCSSATCTFFQDRHINDGK